MPLKIYQSLNGQDSVEKKWIDYCEFDLVDDLLPFDPNVMDQLPPECKTIPAELRAAMKTEALKFKEFMEALAIKENWNEYENDPTRETRDIDKELRQRVYGNVPDDLGNCTMPSDTNDEFIACRTRYREQLLTNIEKE